MAKLKERNNQLKRVLGGIAPKERIIESMNIPQEDTVNREGFRAYSLADEIRLVSILNTCKLESQMYRSDDELLCELRNIIERLCINGNSYFVCQAIVWSRCLGEGMRDMNNIAAAIVAPFISGTDYAKRFYGLFDKKKKQGGCIYRLDDMAAIKDVFDALGESTLTNAMKKGFKSVLESVDSYTLAKYRKVTMDIANLVHPNPSNSEATVKVILNNEESDMKTLDAIMRGITVSADTWEVAQSEAGQEVAQAIKDGKITTQEAEKILSEAKNTNWKEMLKEGSLGILAALRNIRNIMKDGDLETIDLLCKLISDGKKIINGKIMPYQIDIARVILEQECCYHKMYHMVSDALIKGYEKSLPNLKDALPGKTCVVLDCSGSMFWAKCRRNRNGKTDAKDTIKATALDKASLIASTLAIATDADIILFGSGAEYYTKKIAKNTSPFTLAEKLSEKNYGSTNIASVFELMTQENKKYDRIIILSDNECNTGNWTRTAYKNYIHNVCSPYVYCIDFCAYGTTPFKNNGKVNYYYGYGYAMFDDIATREFNPEAALDKIRAVVI